jgi:hypothetical protein
LAQLLGQEPLLGLSPLHESLFQIGDVQITSGNPLSPCLILRQRLFQPSLQQDCQIPSLPVHDSRRTVQTQCGNVKTSCGGEPFQTSGTLVFPEIGEQVIPQGMQEPLCWRKIRCFREQCSFVLVTSHTGIHEIFIAIISTR